MNNKEMDAEKFKTISLASEVLIFSISDNLNDNYRKLSKKKLSVLLIKREKMPFNNSWCLPGKIINIDETGFETAKNIMSICTNDSNYYLEQLKVFDAVDRDPIFRLISSSYLALISKEKIIVNNAKSVSWFNIDAIENNDILELVLDNGNEKLNIILEKIIKENNQEDYSYKIIKNDNLAYDHAIIIAEGIKNLREKASKSDIIFNMMPEFFTIGELQQVYEEILNKKLLGSAFRRTIANKVIETDKTRIGEGHRPSKLFTYQNNKAN